MNEYTKTFDNDPRIEAAAHVLFNVAMEEAKKAGRSPMEFDGMQFDIDTPHGSFDFTLARPESRLVEQSPVEDDKLVIAMARGFGCLMEAIVEKEGTESCELTGKEVACYGVGFAVGLSSMGVPDDKAFEISSEAKAVIINLLDKAQVPK